MSQHHYLEQARLPPAPLLHLPPAPLFLASTAWLMDHHLSSLHLTFLFRLRGINSSIYWKNNVAATPYPFILLSDVIVYLQLNVFSIFFFNALTSLKSNPSVDNCNLNFPEEDIPDPLFDKMRAFYRRGDDAFTYYARPLWLIMGMEFWYRHCIEPGGGDGRSEQAGRA